MLVMCLPPAGEGGSISVKDSILDLAAIQLFEKFSTISGYSALKIGSSFNLLIRWLLSLGIIMLF